MFQLVSPAVVLYLSASSIDREGGLISPMVGGGSSRDFGKSIRAIVHRSRNRISMFILIEKLAFRPFQRFHPPFFLFFFRWLNSGWEGWHWKLLQRSRVEAFKSFSQILLKIWIFFLLINFTFVLLLTQFFHVLICVLRLTRSHYLVSTWAGSLSHTCCVWSGTRHNGYLKLINWMFNFFNEVFLFARVLNFEDLSKTICEKFGGWSSLFYIVVVTKYLLSCY